MALPDFKSHRISLADAVTHTQKNDGSIKGGFFFRKDLDDLLAQPGCAGVRYYYGKDSKGNETIVLVGVDGNGDDLSQGVIMEDGFWCPPWCGSSNLMNS